MAAAADNRTKPVAGEAERSGKRGYCAAFNEALPVQKRHQDLSKVRAKVSEVHKKDTVKMDTARYFLMVWLKKSSALLAMKVAL